MVFYIKLFFATLVAFFVIDMVWLGLVARSFYSKYLGFIMAPSTNWYAAILFYSLFIVGILVFVVVPGLESNSIKSTLIHAALFGLVTYATYDLTNLATLKNWPVLLTIVDITWGIVLSVSVSTISFYAGKWLS